MFLDELDSFLVGCCRHTTTLWQNLLFADYRLQFSPVMAIETAGQKAAKIIKVRIENASTIQLPKDVEGSIKKVLDYLPIEQYRGVEKIKLVDFINDPRLKNMDVPLAKGTGRRGLKCRWERCCSRPRAL